MKRFVPLILAVGLVLGSVGGASSVEFKVKGEWDHYFNFGEASMFKKPYDSRNSEDRELVDVFVPDSRIRMQLDAAVSENLSGTLQFEIGYIWGQSGGGAAGERSAPVRMRQAYIDWLVPGTELRTRMGIQNVALPNVAGGSAVLDEDVAAIAASYKFNDHVSISALWLRPYNDNYIRDEHGGRNADNAFDNLDLAMLAVPLSFDGFSLTPWGMFGMMGKNAARFQLSTGGIPFAADDIQSGLFPVDLAMVEYGDNDPRLRFNRTYAAMFWVGIPITIDAFDPFNFAFDFNYGYMSGFGRYDDPRVEGRRNDSRREGFVVKALAEYKTDWGVPGIFGWYGSGDSGNLRNGSGRMPHLVPAGNFTSFGQDGNFSDMDYSNLAVGERINKGFSGTWAVGAQVRDMSFLEDLSHTLRVAYWRGTNDPAMAKSLRDIFVDDPDESIRGRGIAWSRHPGSLYLTRNDYMVEFNLDTTYQIYENLEACVELGYIVNGMDKSTWKWSGNQKGDAWKATLNFRYSF